MDEKKEKVRETVIDYQKCWQFMKDSIMKSLELNKLMGVNSASPILTMMINLEKKYSKEEIVQ